MFENIYMKWPRVRLSYAQQGFIDSSGVWDSIVPSCACKIFEIRCFVLPNVQASAYTADLIYRYLHMKTIDSLYVFDFLWLCKVMLVIYLRLCVYYVIGLYTSVSVSACQKMWGNCCFCLYVRFVLMQMSPTQSFEKY